MYAMQLAHRNLGASLMKISSIVIALSLIGAPLPAFAVCVQLDSPEVCAGRMAREAQQDRWDAENAAIERKETADKLAKALAIRDEDVLSFPGNLCRIARCISDQIRVPKPT